MPETLRVPCLSSAACKVADMQDTILGTLKQAQAWGSGAVAARSVLLLADLIEDGAEPTEGLRSARLSERVVKLRACANAVLDEDAAPEVSVSAVGERLAAALASAPVHSRVVADL
jgi:hypothetical protein